MEYLKRVHHTAKEEEREELTEEEQQIIEQWYKEHNEKLPMFFDF